jgi:multidrug efflux pump
MGQISGAIIGVTVVLISVFVPLAFFTGAVGNIYRQFSAVMARLDRLLGLPGTVTHARACAPRCSSRSRPATTTPRPASSAGSTAASRAPPNGYEGTGRAHAAAHRRMLIVYGAIVAARGVAVRPPADLVPAQRGPGQHCSSTCNCRLAPRINRTRQGDGAGRGLHAQAARGQSMVSVLGFSFSGSGQNAALGFVTLKDWDERRSAGPVGTGAGAARVRCAGWAFATPSSSP